MREPPLGLEAVPDANLEIFFDEILCAPTTEELLLGLYEKALPALKPALEQHQARHQSARRRALGAACAASRCWKLEDMLAFGAQAIASLVDRSRANARRMAGAAGSTACRRGAGGNWMAPQRQSSHVVDASIPPSPIDMTACPSATRASPIPTTWA